MDPSKIQWRPFQQRPAQCSRGTVCCLKLAALRINSCGEYDTPRTTAYRIGNT